MVVCKHGRMSYEYVGWKKNLTRPFGTYKEVPPSPPFEGGFSWGGRGRIVVTLPLLRQDGLGGGGDSNQLN